MNFRRLIAAKPAIRMLCSSLCFLLLGFNPVAHAASSALTLRAAIAATLADNPELHLYPLRKAEILSEHSLAALKPPLQINAGAEDLLGSGALQFVDATEFTLSLSQVVELGEQREARIGINGQRQQRLQGEQQIIELELLTEVTRRFIATAAAQQEVALQSKAVELAEQTHAALQALVDAGQSPRYEQIRAGAALARSRLALTQANSDLEVARLRLAAMWNSYTPDFDEVSADLLNIGNAGDLTTLLLELADNPNLSLFANEERLRTAQLREAQSSARGTLQWTAGVRYLREPGDAALVLGFSMPLGSKSRASGAIGAAASRLQQVESEREVALNRMRTQLFTLHVQLRQAIAEVNSLRDEVLPQLEQVQTQTLSAYQSGRYSYLELTTAQQEYLNAEHALIDAATDAHLLRTEIEHLSGSALSAGSQELVP